MPKKIDSVRDRILEVTRQDLLTDDSGTLSMRRIAEQCGIAVGTIYNYFPGKMILMASVMEKDWKAQYNKAQMLIRNCNGMADGLAAVYRMVKEFTDRYRSVWDVYEDRGNVRVALNQNHRKVREQMDQLVQGLLLQTGHPDEQKLTGILSECILQAAVFQHIDEGELHYLCHKLFPKEGKENEQF